MGFKLDDFQHGTITPKPNLAALGNAKPRSVLGMDERGCAGAATSRNGRSAVDSSITAKWSGSFGMRAWSAPTRLQSGAK